MKILYATTTCFEKGGIGRYSRYQIRAIRELFGKENVCVMSLLGPDEFSLEEAFNVYWQGTATSTLKNKWNFVWQLRKIAKTFKPDYVHSAHINLSPITNYAAKRVGAISIVNAYGHEVWSKFAIGAKSGLLNADALLSDCHYTADFMENVGYRAKGSVKVIWDCADLERFRPGEPPRELMEKYAIKDKKNSLNIMTLGRIAHGAKHKGYERLLEVFKLVCKEVKNAQLIFVGGGDFLEDLKKLADTIGVSDKVVFTGRIPEKELDQIYKCASVFCLVSDRGVGRGEGIPLTPIEAMACGIPIIVGNQDGSQEAVDQGKNGWVIDPFDLKEHARILIEIEKNKSLLTQKESKLSEVLNTRFSYQVFKEKHIELYPKRIN